MASITTDYEGNEISIGDVIAFEKSGKMRRGFVTKFTPYGVTIEDAMLTSPSGKPATWNCQNKNQVINLSAYFWNRVENNSTLKEYLK